MVDLVALLEAAQDADRVLDGGLAHVDGLEAPLEGGVLLDVLLVLVERRGADAAQLAARERGLEHVRGVHRALGRARADDRVQLVDEEDDLALGLGDLLEHGLQPVLELAAVLGARDEGAEVEGDHALVLERLGDVALDDALGEALDDRGLADARLADEHGVVLGAAREDLDDAAHLVVAADHGVELALAGELGQVAAVLLEGLVAVLGVRVVTVWLPRISLSTLSRAIARGARALQAPRRPGSSTSSSASSRCSVETYWSLSASASRRACLRMPSSFGETWVAAPCVFGREARLFSTSAARPPGVHPELAERGRDDAALLLEQRLQEVLGRHLRVVALLRQGLGGRQGLLGLHRELVETHAFRILRYREDRA